MTHSLLLRILATREFDRQFPDLGIACWQKVERSVYQPFMIQRGLPAPRSGFSMGCARFVGHPVQAGWQTAFRDWNRLTMAGWCQFGWCDRGGFLHRYRLSKLPKK